MACQITRAVLLAALAVALLAPPAQAAFPGANGKIVFGSDRNPAGLYTVNADGSSAIGVPRQPPHGPALNPAWSQDGRKLAFECPFSVCMMNSDGTGEVALPEDASGDYFWPSWSPEGTLIAAAFRYYVFENLWTDIVLLGTTSPYSDSQITSFANTYWPAWSPDGSRIAWGDDGDIVVQGVGQVTTDPALDSAPNWSPDGQRIVFASTRDGNSEIYLMNADGSAQTRLTTDPATDTNPAFSPDGHRIAFESSRDGNREIYVMNADGNGQTNITNHPAADSKPDWQPLRALNPFPRPGGGTPLIAYLVPAFEQCTSPNTQHVAPLAEGSCTPPLQSSDLLTTSKIGVGQGFVRLDVTPGNPATQADEADVTIETNISDVRNASDQSDYSGQVLLSSVLRITDRASGFGGVSATVSDFRFDVPVSCTPTAVAPIGSDCQILTSADSLVPGMVAEGKRSVVSTHNFQLLDAGADGDVTPASGCPPTCGTGDEQTYLEQGTFTP